MGKSTYMVKPSQLRRKPIRGKTEKNIYYMKTKLQPLSLLRGETIKAYKKIKAFFGINSIGDGDFFL